MTLGSQRVKGYCRRFPKKTGRNPKWNQRVNTRRFAGQCMPRLRVTLAWQTEFYGSGALPGARAASYWKSGPKAKASASTAWRSPSAPNPTAIKEAARLGPSRRRGCGVCRTVRVRGTAARHGLRAASHAGGASLRGVALLREQGWPEPMLQAILAHADYSGVDARRRISTRRSLPATSWRGFSRRARW